MADSSFYKWTSLGILVVQNCSQMLLMRYSRTSGPAYLSSTAVTVTELLKLLISFLIVCKECKWDMKKIKAVVNEDLLSWETLYVGVPVSSLYF